METGKNAKTMLILSTCAALVIAGAAIIGTEKQNFTKVALGGTAGDYSLALGADTVINHDGNKYVTTTSGNEIWFNFDNLAKGTGYFGDVASGKYFGNSTAINSIKSISASIASGSLRVYYGFTYTYAGAMYDSGINLTSSTTSVDLATAKPSFVRFYAEAATKITSLTINYSCPVATEDANIETVLANGYENLDIDSGYSTTSLIARTALDGGNVCDTGSKRSLKVTFAGQTAVSWPHIGLNLEGASFPTMTTGKIHARFKISSSMHTWASAKLVDSAWAVTAEIGTDFGSADSNGWYDWSIDVSKFANANKIYRLELNFYNKSTDSSEQYVYIDRLGFDTGYEGMAQDTGWQASTVTSQYDSDTIQSGTTYQDIKLTGGTSGEKFVLNPAAASLTATMGTATKMEFDIKASNHLTTLTGGLAKIRVIDANWKSSTNSASTLTAKSNGWYHATWSDFAVVGDDGYAQSAGIIRVCFMLDNALLSGSAYVLIDNIVFTF